MNGKVSENSVAADQKDQGPSPELSEHTGGWSCYTTSPSDSLERIEAARARCPVAFSNEFDGFHMLLGHRDVRKGMSDYRTFSSEPMVLRPILPRKQAPALDMDPPRHAQWRAIFNAAVEPNETPQLMEPFLRADVRRHIARFASWGECDIVKELASPLPAEAIFHLVGIDDEKVPPIRDSSLRCFAAMGNPDEYEKQLAEFAALVLPEVQDRIANPRNDFLSSLATREVEGHPIGEEDYILLLSAFLGAGHHTTTAALSSMINEVFSRPDLVELLRNEPDKIPVVIEETLRLRPSAWGVYRRAKKPIEMSGVAIEPGEDVWMGLAAANRDPAVFEQPAEFRMDRGEFRHFAFGFGIHTCPGAPLARMEMRVVLEELLNAFSDFRVERKMMDADFRFGGGDYCYLPSLKVYYTPRDSED